MGEGVRFIDDHTFMFVDFMGRVSDDPRIGPSHISLFMAILHVYTKQENKEPITVFSRELMKQAKISAVGTYHRCIKQLHRYGFIYYIPSYNPIVGSLIYINKTKQK